MYKRKEEQMTTNKERRKFQDTVIQDFEKTSGGDNRAQQLKLLSTINFYQTLAKRPNKETPLFPSDSSRSNHSMMIFSDKSNSENLERSFDFNQKEKKAIEGVIYNNIRNQIKKKVTATGQENSHSNSSYTRVDQTPELNKQFSEEREKSKDRATEKKGEALTYADKYNKGLRKPLGQKDLIENEGLENDDTRFSYQYTPNGGKKKVLNGKKENTNKTPVTSEWKSSLKVNEGPKNLKDEMEKLASSFRKKDKMSMEEKILNQARLEALLSSFDKNEKNNQLLSKINIDGKKVTNLNNFLSKAKVVTGFQTDTKRAKTPLASARTPLKSTKYEQQDYNRNPNVLNKSLDKNKTPQKLERNPFDKKVFTSRSNLLRENLHNTPTRTKIVLSGAKQEMSISAKSSKSPLGGRSSGGSSVRIDHIDKSEERKTPTKTINSSYMLKGKTPELRASRTPKVNDIMPSVNSSFRYKPNYFEPMEKEELERVIDEELNIRSFPKETIATSRTRNIMRKSTKSSEGTRSQQHERKNSLEKSTESYIEGNQNDKYFKLDSLIADLRSLSVLDSMREMEKEADA